MRVLLTRYRASLVHQQYLCNTTPFPVAETQKASKNFRFSCFSEIGFISLCGLLPQIARSLP